MAIDLGFRQHASRLPAIAKYAEEFVRIVARELRTESVQVEGHDYLRIL